MSIVLNILAGTVLIIVLGILALGYMVHCQSCVTEREDEEIERRAKELAENAHVIIKHEIIFIDETKEGVPMLRSEYSDRKDHNT